MSEEDTTNTAETTETAEKTRSDREDGGPTGTGEPQGEEAGQEGHGHGDKPSNFEPHE